MEDRIWSESSYSQKAKLRELAGRQLGTVGSGNHYVDVFSDEQDRIWVGLHFGSCGLGHRIASHFLTVAGPGPNAPMTSRPAMLGVGSEAGAEYLELMALAGRYAYAGRDEVCSAVAKTIGAPILEKIHNHHNFAWQELHGGEEYWVVRKGATPAFPGQLGFVGGSMGDASVILRGVDSDKSRRALYSTVHGAGRVMSRTRAASKKKWRHGKATRISAGEVDFEAVKRRIAGAGIELRGAGAVEAPEVYRRLSDVVAAHAGTIEVVHTLRPLVVVMAGADDYDPYMDKRSEQRRRHRPVPAWALSSPMRAESIVAARGRLPFWLGRSAHDGPKTCRGTEPRTAPQASQHARIGRG